MRVLLVRNVARFRERREQKADDVAAGVGPEALVAAPFVVYDEQSHRWEGGRVDHQGDVGGEPFVSRGELATVSVIADVWRDHRVGRKIPSYGIGPELVQ